MKFEATGYVSLNYSVTCPQENHIFIAWIEYLLNFSVAESISKFGSGFFLLIQVVLLLDFVHGWNDKWVGYDEQFWLVFLFF